MAPSAKRFPLLPLKEEERLKHHLNQYQLPEWVQQHMYLHACPEELMLRDHV